MSIMVEMEDEQGNIFEHELPTKKAVCDECEGHGTVLHPDIANHAYSREEFEEAFSEEDEREAYFKRGGMYDVQCPQCNGLRVVDVVDEEKAKLTQEGRAALDAYYEKVSEQRAYLAECEMERRMGA